MINFDTIINRRNTSCSRWDGMDLQFGRKDLIHLGIADLDFPSPDPIIEAIQKCVNTKIFSYTELDQNFFLAIQHWYKKNHTIHIETDEILFSPRVITTASLCVSTLTKENDEIFICSPIYNPLYQSIVQNNRTPLEIPFIEQNNRYYINFESLEKKVSSKTKMFILCSPHNPSGRVWTEQELTQLSDFCIRHNLFLFVDEIHSDIISKGVKFTTSLSLQGIRNKLIMASSPSKTFNVAGIATSFAIIPNEEIRISIKNSLGRISCACPTVFSGSVLQAAFTQCSDWQVAFLQYIEKNDTFTRTFFSKNLKDFVVWQRDAGFLLWVDYRALNVSEQELENWLINTAGVAICKGSIFQQTGKGFIRINIASSQKLLEIAYNKLKDALPYLKK
ncbi:MAG: MalY/PatB family protein [Treponemataceae bacterium]